MSTRQLLESAGKAWRAASVDLQEPGIRKIARNVSDQSPDMNGMVELVKQAETSHSR